MKPRDLVIEQIQHHETETVPYTLPFVQDVGDRLDAHYGGNAWRSRIAPFIAQCGSVAKFQEREVDATLRQDVFGTIWRTDLEPRSVVEPGLKAPTFDNYDFPTKDTLFNSEAKTAARKRVAESGDLFTIVSPSLCLWQGWYVRGFETTLMDCVAEEDFFAELLERLTELCLALIDECADIPADAIMMGDDWGVQRGVMVGPERWRKFYKPRYARIFQAIHDQGKFAIMHCCGSVAEILGDIIETGLDVLESVQPEAAGMNPYDLKEAWGDRITFWGGLGTQQTIPFASPPEIRQEVRRLRSVMSRGGGYILAPAKPLRTETPTENAVAVVEAFVSG